MSAPAMKLSGLPEISTTSFNERIVLDSPEDISSNSAASAGLSVFTGSPGASIVTTRTSSVDGPS